MYGHQSWIRSQSDFPNGSLFDLKNEPLAAVYGWEKSSILNIKVCAVETPFNFSIKFRFEKDKVDFSWNPNVGFDNKLNFNIIGHRRN